MAQMEPCLALMSELCERNMKVSIETSGAMDISKIDTRVTVVMDLKAPDSGEMSKNRYANIPFLKANDEVKFVVQSRKDFEWSKLQIAQYQLDKIANVIISPCFGEIDETQLAEWIIADNLPVRFQIQMHKILWNDAKGH